MIKGVIVKDLTGLTIGAWTVESYFGRDDKRCDWWMCRCGRCGTVKKVLGKSLRNGQSRSCGCAKYGPYHGVPEYKVWRRIHFRCSEANREHYHHYGERGITVCERWKSFDAFYADMGKRPNGATIERVNNDLGYSPENCRWATIKEQQNNKRSNIIVVFKGTSMTAAKSAELTGIRASIIRQRVHRGWPASKLFDPPRAWPAQHH